MSDLRKEVSRTINKQIYTIKSLSSMEAFEYLPVVGEILGVSLFSVIKTFINDTTKGEAIEATDNAKAFSSKLFNLKTQDSIKEFFILWKNNKAEIKDLLKAMLKDSYYTLETPQGNIKTPIDIDKFSADELLTIMHLFVFGLEVNYLNFFTQLVSGLGIMDEINLPKTLTDTLK